MCAYMSVKCLHKSAYMSHAYNGRIWSVNMSGYVLRKCIGNVDVCKRQWVHICAHMDMGNICGNMGENVAQIWAEFMVCMYAYVERYIWDDVEQRMLVWMAREWLAWSSACWRIICKSVHCVRWAENINPLRYSFMRSFVTRSANSQRTNRATTAF